MHVRVTCPECDASNTVDEEKRGKKVRCRKCDALIPVPKGKPAPQDDDELEIVEEAPVKKKAAAPAAKKRRDDDYDDEDDDRPRGKKGKTKAKRSPGATIAIVAVLGVVIVGGLGAGLYFAFRDDSGSPSASNNPPPPQPQAPPQGMGAGGPMAMGRGGPGAANAVAPPVTSGTKDTGKEVAKEG